MIKISLGLRDDLDDCCNALEDSKLYDEYFQDVQKSKSFILEGIEKQEVYIAKVDNKNLIGFLRIDEIGMFSNYPFLRLIAVKRKYRSKGYGSELLRFYEDKFKNKVDRIFLCVSSFNENARKLYDSLGFCEIGQINGLYKQGVTEYIMMKEI